MLEEGAWGVVRACEERLREEPEARRALGAYATPQDVARLVASRALLPLVRRGRRIEGLAVLDPACGAGAFLLAAHEVLARVLVERGATEPRARARAVCALMGLEVDEARAEAAREALVRASGYAGAAERILVRDALDDRGLAAISFARPLDAVIGNPPWRREKDAREALARARATALGRRYGAARMDLWYLFAHAALEALAPGGRHAFVVPAYALKAASATRLREHLLSEARLETLVDLGERAFEDASVRAIAYVVEKGRGGGGDVEVLVPGGRPERVRLEDLVADDGTIALATAALRETARAIRRGGAVAPAWKVGEGATPGPDAWTPSVAERAARELATTRAELERERGIRPGEGVFVVDAAFRERRDLSPRERALLLPFALPCEVPRFSPPARVLHAILSLSRETLAAPEEAPALVRHLERFRPALDRRRETRLGRRAFHELHWPRERALFEGPRALLPRMAKRPRGSFVEDALVVGESVIVLKPPRADVARAVAALLCTAPLAVLFIEGAKRRGVGHDASVAFVRGLPWPRVLVGGGALPELPAGSVERVARGEPVAPELAGRGEAHAVSLATALVAAAVGEPDPARARRLDLAADAAAARAYGVDPSRVAEALA